jgi:hypothetical protein
VGESTRIMLATAQPDGVTVVAVVAPDQAFLADETTGRIRSLID